MTLTLTGATGNTSRVPHRDARGMPHGDTCGVAHRNADGNLPASRLSVRHLLLVDSGSVVAKGLIEVKIGTGVRVSYVVSHMG